MISIFFVIAVILLIAGGVLFFTMLPRTNSDKYHQGAVSDAKLFKWVGFGVFVVGLVTLVLTSTAIIETGKSGVVRVFGVVQEETLGVGFNFVQPWATVARQETRGFQLEQVGDNAMEVLTANGTKFTVELGIPFKFNPEAAALVESRINKGNWRGEVLSVARGQFRTSVASYDTFGEFNTRRASTVDGILYGKEVADEISTAIDSLFCDTYDICNIKAVRVGDLIIRKVNPPAAITSEAASLEAAKLSEQTERALNAVEIIRAERRTQEGLGYGNLFSFLPDGSDLNADEAANFLRASADKTRADAESYMQRQLAESISDAMAKGLPIPSIIISTGGGSTPVPVFNP